MARCGSTCPTGDIYGTDNTGPKNFILQTAPSGDWTMETKVDGSLLNEQYQQAGLIVLGDDDNYLKFDFVADNQAGQAVTRRIEFRSEIAGAVQNPQPQVEQPDLGGVAPAAGPQPATPSPRRTRPTGRPGRRWSALTNSAVGATPEGRVCSPSAPTRPPRRPASFDYFRLSTDGRSTTTAPVTTATVSGTPTEGLVHRAGHGHPRRHRRGRR